METKKDFLIIINNGPYGDERSYNALRLGLNLAKRPEANVRVFLIGDGVQCAAKNQKLPQGFYNIERMIRFLAARGEVGT